LSLPKPREGKESRLSFAFRLFGRFLPLRWGDKCAIAARTTAVTRSASRRRPRHTKRVELSICHLQLSSPTALQLRLLVVSFKKCCFCCLKVKFVTPKSERVFHSFLCLLSIFITLSDCSRNLTCTRHRPSQTCANTHAPPMCQSKRGRAILINNFRLVNDFFALK
jgi:hypothetical protein